MNKKLVSTTLWENIQREHTYYPGTTLLHSYNDEPAEIEYWVESGQNEKGQTCSQRKGIRSKAWRHRGAFYQENDKPTVEFYDRQGNLVEQQWRDKNGKFDRQVGPARISFEDGEWFDHWYQAGVLHRKGKPAVIGNRGSEIWYNNGKISRTDGRPAVTMHIFINDEPVCEQQWRVNNEAHRVEGAAVVRSNGEQEYWVGGRQVNEMQHMAIAAKLQDISDPLQEYLIAKELDFDHDKSLTTRHQYDRPEPF